MIEDVPVLAVRIRRNRSPGTVQLERGHIQRIVTADSPRCAYQQQSQLSSQARLRNTRLLGKVQIMRCDGISRLL